MRSVAVMLSDADALALAMVAQRLRLHLSATARLIIEHQLHSIPELAPPTSGAATHTEAA